VATGAFASTLAPGVPFAIHEIRLHLSNTGAAENFTATLDSAAGAIYDAVIYSAATTGISDLNHHPSMPFFVAAATDEVDFALANTSNRVVGLEVVWTPL